MHALTLKWSTIAYGGSWDIVSDQGDIIAVEIPFGAYADHIVNLHNRSLAPKPQKPGPKE